MSSPVPPPLPELGLQGGRPAAGSIGPVEAVIRLGARVVATAGRDFLIETAQGRAVLQGAPPLRPGAALILEFTRADATPLRTGRLVTIDQQRLEPPVPIRLRPAHAAQPATTARPDTGLEVKLRPLGPEGRPLGPPVTARLVPSPEPGSLATRSRLSPPPPAAVAAAPRGSIAPSASMPAQATPPINPASMPMMARAGAASPAPSTVPLVPANTPAPPAHSAAPEPAQVLAVRHPIEVIVLRREARGRVLLRSAGMTFAVETPVRLPVGARLQVILPAGLARSHSAPESGPLKAVRELASWLSEEAGPDEPVNTATPRVPEATATLAARLLRLVQLITQHSGASGLRSAPEPAGAEAQSGAARITAALAELGRLAGEPQSGGWRAFLLPLGFEGAPLLRLHLREEPYQDEGGKDRRPARSPVSRRAVFELEFGKLGRCQIDVLCQAQRFDLIVRTEQPLEPQLRREIRALYVAAREGSGLLGELRFRAGEWVSLPELSGPGGPGAGITV